MRREQLVTWSTILSKFPQNSPQKLKVSLFFSVLLFFRKSPTTGSFDCWASVHSSFAISACFWLIYFCFVYIFINLGIFSGMYVEALKWLTSLTCFRYSLSTKWIPRNQEPIRVMGSWRIPIIIYFPLFKFYIGMLWNATVTDSEGLLLRGLYSEGLIYGGKFAFQNRLG